MDMDKDSPDQDNVTELPQRVVAKITVNLVDRGAVALNELCERTGLNKTDVVNRALQLYNFADELMAKDGKLISEDAEGKRMRVQFF